MTCHHEDAGLRGQVWVLGATGRSGRRIAAALAQGGVPPVLVGRDEERLKSVRSSFGLRGAVLRVADLKDMAVELKRHAPSVVVNTAGPFSETAAVLTAACLKAGSDYVDLANDLAAVRSTLLLDQHAVKAGRCFVTGAGFGVTATEGVVLSLCEGQSRPSHVRTDMIPSLAVEGGKVGRALAATLVEGNPGVPGGGRYQGRRYARGSLTSDQIGGHPTTVVLPSGARVTTVAMPLGELFAAQRASQADEVISATSEAPTSAAFRLLFPVVAGLLAVAPIRRAARSAVANVTMKAAPMSRPFSYARAQVSWPDGRQEEGWLQLGDAQEFTASVCATVAARLHAGVAQPGAFTPGALFGPSLAIECGARYLPGEQSSVGFP